MASADIPLVNPTSESPYIHHNAFSTWRRPVAVMAVGVVFTFLLCVIVLVLTAKTMADVQDLKSDGGDGDGSPDTSPDYRRAVEALKTNMDETVRPCDDFYRFACGGWLERTQIPSDAARYGRFAEIQEGNEKVLNTILEEDWPLLTSFYRSCLDEGRINAHGKTPALPLFTNAGVELYDGTGEGAMKAAAALTRSGIPVFFSLWVDDDLRNALKYGQYIGQGGLSLPDRDYYLDDALASTRDSFVAHMTQMFQYMGIDATQGEEKARGVLAFETEIARISFPKDQLRDPPGTYHKISIADLQTSTDNFPWGTFFQEIGAPDGMDVILQLPINEDKDIQFMQQLGSLITTSSAEDVTAYLQWKVVHGLNGYLSSDFVTETFTFFGKVIDGQSEPVPRWKKCLRDTDAALGGALGHHFVSRVFSEASQEDAGDMIHRIEEAFGLESLAKLEWMDDTTRGRAVTKLGMVTNKVGYPGRFLNYDMLELGQEFFENQKAANDLYWSREMAKIGTDVDPDLWYMTVPTVNAYYTPTGNQMVFPAGILRPPFYNHTYPVQLNYGGIGMVMGHELTHGFDDQGRQFDGSGNLNSWWEEATAAKFEDLAACLVDQYSAFEVQPGVFVNGRLTLGENIADNGGIRNAYFAYKALEQEKGPFARVMEEYTNDQLFFIAFAQTWCTKAKPEMERKLVKVDVHSPPRFRILGPLGNFDEFGKTFSCPKGSTMNPHAKCRIW